MLNTMTTGYATIPNLHLSNRPVEVNNSRCVNHQMVSTNIKTAHTTLTYPIQHLFLRINGHSHYNSP